METYSKQDKAPVKKAYNSTLPPLPDSPAPMPERKITAATTKKYGVLVHNDPEKSEFKHAYPHFDMDGNYIASKLRGHTKKFQWRGDTTTYNKAGQLFGQQLFPAGSSKAITITEGEIDAMAAFQMQGSRYPCVSVTSAGAAVKDCTRNFKYLNSFPEIRICFDKDEAKVAKDGSVYYPGQDAARAVASLFEIGKVRIITLQEHKDASDYLVEGKAQKFMKEWWDAPSYTPAGLVLAKDMWEKIKEPKSNDSLLYPFDSLNEKTYGIRKSEFVIATAQTGVGKTSLIKEIEHKLLTQDKVGVGTLHLEEPNDDTALGLLSITANKPLHLPDIRANVGRDELRGYFDKTLDNDRLVMWDHFGSNTIDEVIANIRYMHNMGCEYIFLDHLSILVSDQNGDERKQLDEAATKLKTLCMELNIALIGIIHQNRSGEIRGTAGVEQLANIVIKIERDVKSKSDFVRNITVLTIEKNRFCGRTGPAGYLKYDAETGRLVPLSPEEIALYEKGTEPEDFGDNETWTK